MLTPERILDYFPGAITGVTLEAIICKGKSAVSLIERVASEPNEQPLTVKVTTASPFAGELSRENLMANIFFTMMEDWQVEAHEGARV